MATDVRYSIELTRSLVASYQSPPTKKSNTGRWIGGAALLLVALVAIVVLLLNRQLAPAAPASAIIVSAVTVTSEPADTPTAVNSPTPAPTDTPTSTPMPELGTSNIFIEYILDASGSMTETLSDGSPKIDVAKRLLTEHMRSFRPETNIGLRAYGHRLPYQQTAESCQDIELVAPVEKGQMERIVGFLQGFEPQGMTPLAASLQQAQEDFVYEAPRVNSIVMLSDGIETCGGNPCKLVEDLKAQGINFTIHVIGLDVDDPTREQLSCIAQAGGGTYHDTNNQQELNAALGTVKVDVTQGEIVVPPGVATPTPKPTSTAVPAGATWASPVDGMVQVYVPAGEFLMGSTDDDLALWNYEVNPFKWVNIDDEKPQHSVYLNAFWIDRTEVTYNQYQQCAAAGKCAGIYDTGQENYPVSGVSWQDAANYCAWVGRRLPTEAEWEKAARGTNARLFPWGNEAPDCSQLNCQASTSEDCAGRGVTPSGFSPVGSYPAGASPYGALDMAGNVAEWVADWYDETYYADTPTQNPTGPASGEYRVNRGGSSVTCLWYHHTAARYALEPDNPKVFGGFRCARSD